MLDKVKNDLINNLNEQRNKSWHTTPLGDPRGYIRPQNLQNCGFIPALLVTWRVRFV